MCKTNLSHNGGRQTAVKKRKASISRDTAETKISASINLDGEGIYDIETGIGFLDHMLEQLSRHSLIDITLKAEGDLHIDQHHTTEDCGIVIGQAVKEALGDNNLATFADSNDGGAMPALRFISGQCLLNPLVTIFPLISDPMRVKSSETRSWHDGLWRLSG